MLEKAEIRCRICNKVLVDMISATRHICLKKKEVKWRTSAGKIKND